jgi:RNA polymerase sigma-70 factor (ECF subfamily)
MTQASPSPNRHPHPPLPAAVLIGARDGDPKALGELFEACFDDIFGLAVRMLGDRTQAEDVVQEVFLRLHRSAATLDVSRDPRPWLRTLTANLCRDHWRSFGAKVNRGSVPVDEDPAQGQALVHPGPTPEAETLAGQRADRVQAAIDQLPDDLREVVVLRGYQDLAHDEIAEMVGASPAAVRKRYSRALGALGELLKDIWP